MQERGGIEIMVWELVYVHVLETLGAAPSVSVLPSTVTRVNVIFKKTEFGNSQPK